MRTRVAAILLVMLVGCASTVELGSRDIRQAYGVRYAAKSGTEVSFEKETAGEPTAWFYMPNGLGEGLGEGLGSPLRDCGNDRYRCISFGSSVVAVPRSGLKAGEAFQIGGARIVVLTCEERAGALCSRALVRSVCEWRDPGEWCGDASGHALKGWPTTFLIDDVAGVIWWSTSDDCAADSLSQECRGGAGFDLRSPQGLLASEAESQ